MPNLHIIEKSRRYIANQTINKKIAGFKIFDSSILRSSQALFSTKTTGSYIKRIDRLGRLLIFKLASGYYLFVYLSSIGEITYHRTKYTHALIKFKNNFTLYFNKLKPHGYLQITNDRQRKRLLAALADDPAAKNFTYLKFRQLLRNKSTSVMDFLSNAKYFLGISRQLARKICSLARVNPEHSVKFIPDSHKKRLYRAIRKLI